MSQPLSRTTQGPPRAGGAGPGQVRRPLGPELTLPTTRGRATHEAGRERVSERAALAVADSEAPVPGLVILGWVPGRSSCLQPEHAFLPGPRG